MQKKYIRLVTNPQSYTPKWIESMTSTCTIVPNGRILRNAKRLGEIESDLMTTRPNNSKFAAENGGIWWENREACICQINYQLFFSSIFFATVLMFGMYQELCRMFRIGHKRNANPQNALEIFLWIAFIKFNTTIKVIKVFSGIGRQFAVPALRRRIHSLTIDFIEFFRKPICDTSRKTHERRSAARQLIPIINLRISCMQTGYVEQFAMKYDRLLSNGGGSD